MSPSLSEMLLRAFREKWALPHFNISNLELLRGICEAARALRAPLLIGASESERNFIGLRRAVVLIREFAEEYKIPFWLNADHSYSVEAAKKAIDAGYDSVHIDLSKKILEENIRGAYEVVRYARQKNPRVSVEGELGYLVTESSKLYKKKIIVDPETFTKPAEAERFIKKTGVNRFAPAVGNLHGIAINRPKINFKLVRELRKIMPPDVAMVLHGGSGNSPAVFRKLIDLGVNNIHISTELRLSYKQALEKSLKANRGELAPYRIMAPVVEQVRKKAETYIKIFRANNKV